MTGTAAYRPRPPASDDDVPRGGHGRVMLALAEDFARERGRHFVTLSAHPDAVGFYERFGYRSDGVGAGPTAAAADLMPMSKQLV